MDAQTNKRNAWISLLGLPIALIAVTIIGYGLGAALGYGDGELFSAPWAALMMVVIVVFFAVPTALAFRFGRRARKLGDASAMVPAWIALGLSAVFLAQNLLAFFFS